MNFLKKIFVNDWITIEVILGEYHTEWKNSAGYKVQEEDDEHTTFYNIQYSISKNKLRLKVEGREADCILASKIKAVKRLAELNKLLLTNKIEDVINK